MARKLQRSEAGLARTVRILSAGPPLGATTMCSWVLLSKPTQVPSIQLDWRDSFRFGSRSSFDQLPCRTGLAMTCSPHSKAMPLKFRI